MTHIVQSSQWGKFKTKMGTEAIAVGDTKKIQYTKHKIPFVNAYMAYAPKVNPFDIDFKLLKESLENEECIAINFDVPNIMVGSPDEENAIKALKKYCKKSPKDTFAKSNVILDLSASEDEILSNMHKKHRYNIKLAEKKGVYAKIAESKEDFDIFYKLLEETSQRQKYYIHSKEYYESAWDTLRDENMCQILIAMHEDTPLASWMLFNYEDTLYYPYGGSSNEKKHLQASTFIAWEAIKLGKSLNLKTFDLWGASKDPNDETDDWHGFTNFKLRLGGKHVTYIDSFDYLVNDSMYLMFNTANSLRWKILNLIK